MLTGSASLHPLSKQTAVSPCPFSKFWVPALIWIQILQEGTLVVRVRSRKSQGFPGGTVGNRPGFDPWVRKIPCRRKRQPTPVFLPGESHGWRSLVGYGPRGRKESHMTERLHLVLSTVLSHDCEIDLQNFLTMKNWNSIPIKHTVM